MAYPFLIQSATCPYTIGQWDAGEGMHPECRGRGVPDAHFAKAEHVASLLAAQLHHFSSMLKAALHLLFAHGGFMQEIGCTTAHLSVDDASLVGKVVIHSGIYNLQFKSMLTAEEIHSGPSMEEVEDLLPGNLFGRYAHSLGHDTMVSSEDDVLRMAELRRQRLLNQSNLQGQLLQPA